MCLPKRSGSTDGEPLSQGVEHSTAQGVHIETGSVEGGSQCQSIQMCVLSGQSLISDLYCGICQSVSFICVYLQARCKSEFAHPSSMNTQPHLSYHRKHLPQFIKKQRIASIIHRSRSRAADGLFFLSTDHPVATQREDVIPGFLGYFYRLCVCFDGMSPALYLCTLAVSTKISLDSSPSGNVSRVLRSIFNHLE